MTTAHTCEEEVHREVGRHVGPEQTAGLAFLHDRAEPVVVAPARRPYRRPLGRLQQVHGPEEHGGPVEVLDCGHHHIDGDRPQPVHGGTRAARQPLQPVLLHRQDPVVDLEQQVVLCLEVVVHRALGDPGRGDDLADRGRLVPLLGEQPDGRLDQPAPYRRLLRPRHKLSFRPQLGLAFTYPSNIPSGRYGA